MVGFKLVTLESFSVKVKVDRLKRSFVHCWIVGLYGMKLFYWQ